MQLLNKKVILSALATITGLILSISFSGVVRAEAIRPDLRDQLFCQRIDSIAERLRDDAANFRGASEPVQLNHDGSLVERRLSFDKKLDAFRKNAESAREMHIQAMLKRAKNNQQSQAIEQYNIALKQAIESRQASIDSIIHNYRDQVDAALEQAESKRVSNRRDFLTMTAAAIDQAKSDCKSADGDTAAVIRQTLLQDIVSARNKLATDSSQLSQTAIAIHQARDTGRNQIADAFKQFATSVEQARQQLITSVGSLLQ